MRPRQHAPRRRASPSLHAPSTCARSWRNHRLLVVVALLVCISLGSTRVVGAQSHASDDHEQAAPSSPSWPSQSHYNGLHELSGKSFRAFTNRLRRQLRGVECLRFHEAGTWWHYEWCIGRFVRQYHPFPTTTVDSNSPTRSQQPEQEQEQEQEQSTPHRTTGKTDSAHTNANANANDGSDGDQATEWTILLGRFSATTSRRLRILPVVDMAEVRDRDTQGYYAAQTYNRGDLCDADVDVDGAEAQPRTVIIQYACCVFRANETYIEAITEHERCSYTLHVCSPVACGLMQRDQYVLSAPAHVGEEERLALVRTVKDMFAHAYEGYLTHAFPLDELMPLSCQGAQFELGKIPMLTLIDTLDTLAVLQDGPRFRHAVALVVKNAHFDLDASVSVFETTIRVLGGLLSAHLFAIDDKLALFPRRHNGSSHHREDTTTTTTKQEEEAVYTGELLTLAKDLGDRLMPAFATATGIPFGTVNLRHGVPQGETPIASTAGAGSLSMEFTMLSVLTKDPRYATHARRAVRALFVRRSSLGLLGKHINTKTGEWTETTSGPGSNSDSFYEYLWKMYVAFQDEEALEMLETVYPAVMARNRHGDWFTDVSMWTGCNPHTHSRTQTGGIVFENLVSFWPGMQASMGHLTTATSSMNAFYRIWREYGFVPEKFDVGPWKPVRNQAGFARYPLRPELIEATYHMHHATNDSSWLRAGAHVVHSLQKHTKTECGYASVRDVERHELEDTMPSFFLSETCKYLYLLFNTTHFMRNGGYVLTTEAHPFPILPRHRVVPMLEPTLVSDEDRELDSQARRRDVADIVLGVSESLHVGQQCPVPAFWHAFGYQVGYRGDVVMRTDVCRKPMCPATRRIVKTATDDDDDGSDGDIDGLGLELLTLGHDGTVDWLPTLKAKLFEGLDGLQLVESLGQLTPKAATHRSVKGIDMNDVTVPVRLHVRRDVLIQETASDILHCDEDVHRVTERRKRAEKARNDRSEKLGQENESKEGGTEETSLVDDMDEEHMMWGNFSVDRHMGALRVTRLATKEWISAIGLFDPRFLVLSWMPKEPAEAAQMSVTEADDVPVAVNDTPQTNMEREKVMKPDASNSAMPTRRSFPPPPSRVPLHRVYDYGSTTHTGFQFAYRRHCSIRVDVTSSSSMSSPSTLSSLDDRDGVDDGDSESFSFSCVGAAFGPRPRNSPTSSAVSIPAAPFALVEPLNACKPLRPQNNLGGKIAVVTRGSCFFEDKVRHAAAQDAVAVVVVNDDRDADRVMVMAGADVTNEYPTTDDDADTNRVSIPAIMVPRRVGEWLYALLETDTDGNDLDSASLQVQGAFELSVETRGEDLRHLQEYLSAVEALEPTENATKDLESGSQRDTYTSMAQTKLARAAYPRVEGNEAFMSLLLPNWGVSFAAKREGGLQMPMDHATLIFQIDTDAQTLKRAQSTSP